MINKEVDYQEKCNQLQKELTWYKSFFENASDAVFIIQPESWNVLDANEYAATLLGISMDVLKNTLLPEFKQIFKLLIKSPSPIVLSELELATPDNNNLLLEVSARFVEHDGQKLIQAIARDVREQSSLTDRLVQADKLVLLGQLSAGVAHEIRNPLAAVNLNLQVLKRNIAKDTPEYQYVDTALQGAERISRIVEITLNFSRPAVPDIKELNLNTLIPPALDLVAAELKKKEIKVDLHLDKNLPCVSADTKQMQQVLINLLTNAADAIISKGNVIIKTYFEKSDNKKTERKYAIMSISDNGIGISPEDIQKIFNPFFTKKTNGTGLGLPITQRIMHQHSGVIDVESSTGKGTTFYVKLPVIK
ncbi:nitrogen regulation protein NR(II) [Bacteroidota bacterium]